MNFNLDSILNSINEITSATQCDAAYDKLTQLNALQQERNQENAKINKAIIETAKLNIDHNVLQEQQIALLKEQNNILVNANIDSQKSLRISIGFNVAMLIIAVFSLIFSITK